MEATTTSSLSEIKDIQEVGITLNAQNLNPATLNVDFLTASGIVPSDWQLARDPVLSAARSQLSFQNGLNIVAQPRTITFAQALKLDSNGNADIGSFAAAAVVSKFVDVLPQSDYQALSIAPRILVSFPSPDRTPREFVVETLLAPGPWREIGTAPAQASVNFIYMLDRCQLTVGLNEVRLSSKAEQKSVPAMLFAGGFNYGLANLSATDRVAKIKTAVQAWATDLTEFQAIVHQKFLGEGGVGSAETIVPPGTVLSAS